MNLGITQKCKDLVKQYPDGVTPYQAHKIIGGRIETIRQALFYLASAGHIVKSTKDKGAPIYRAKARQEDITLENIMHIWANNA